jgi:hypothetical protein
MYAKQNSKSGWVAIGWCNTNDRWVTSEEIYADKKHAVNNLQWCYNVDESTIKAVKVGLK